MLSRSIRVRTSTRSASTRHRFHLRPSAESLEPRLVLTAFGLDPSLNGAGTALTAMVTNALHPITPVAVKADGGVVLAGVVTNAAGNSDFVVQKLTPTGVPDSTFGTDGRVAVGFDLGGDDNDTPGAIAIGADGKIVVAGSAYNATGSVFALARLNPDGTLDPTFGTGGKVTLASPGNVSQAASLVSVLPDGRIIVGGAGSGSVMTTGGTQTTLVKYYDLARLNIGGTPDTTFGMQGTGQLSANAGGVAGAFSNGVSFDASAIGPDGRVVVVENFSEFDALAGVSQSSRLDRFNADGSQDATFGPSIDSLPARGPIASGRNLGSYGNALSIGPDDSIYVAGDFGNALGVTAAGAIDATLIGYGAPGRDVSRREPVGRRRHRRPSRRARRAGRHAEREFQLPHAGPSQLFNVDVLLANGTPDPAFGVPGEAGTARSRSGL